MSPDMSPDIREQSQEVPAAHIECSSKTPVCKEGVLSMTLLVMRRSGPLMCQDWRHGPCNHSFKGTRLFSGLKGGILRLLPC